MRWQRIPIQGQGCHRIPCAIGAVRAVEADAPARDLPGFLPFASRPESARCSAAVVTGYSRRGICGITLFGYLLRIGGRLQRHTDRSVAGTARRKMEYATETKAGVIATANPGCLLQLRAGAEIHKTGQEVLHIVELLDRALAE